VQLEALTQLTPIRNELGEGFGLDTKVQPLPFQVSTRGASPPLPVLS